MSENGESLFDVAIINPRGMGFNSPDAAFENIANSELLKEGCPIASVMSAAKSMGDLVNHTIKAPPIAKILEDVFEVNKHGNIPGIFGSVFKGGGHGRGG